ncbi:hypothetical protein LIER_17104 [Lithospermum erythrorhizon]|uniref:Retroviral polymerase SH3-like domain-containing protein n=1 Tax=Lithospermum erythrorhizon TaxID=34254 RepID=A0AAV3QAI3_LITER
MLSGKNMPKRFWPEAVMWSCYVLNRCPPSSVEGMTPQEAWSGNKPIIDHLTVWGCLARAHVPKLGRDKLDNRSKTCIFIGMNEGTKCYILFNVLTEKVMISRDVLFEEDKQWKWKELQAKPEQNDIEWSNTDGTTQEEAQNDDPADDQNNNTPAQEEKNDARIDEDEGPPNQGRVTTRKGRAL